jgi:hypothetical protein
MAGHKTLGWGELRSGTGRRDSREASAVRGGRREPTERRTGGRRLGLSSGRRGSPPGSGWGSNGEGGQGFKMAAPFYCLPVPDFPFPFRFLDSKLSPHRAETRGEAANTMNDG